MITVSYDSPVITPMPSAETFIAFLVALTLLGQT